MKITEEQKAKLLELLKSLEFSGGYASYDEIDDIEECPSCHKSYFHDDDCLMLEMILDLGGVAWSRAAYRKKQEEEAARMAAERKAEEEARAARLQVELDRLSLTEEALRAVVNYRDRKEGFRGGGFGDRITLCTSAGKEWSREELEKWVEEWRKEVQ